MAIDTVKLRSPSIDEGTAIYLERQCILKQGVELSTGQVLYEITTGDLQGSWDSRISFKVCRDDWITDANGTLQQVTCEPFVLVEASIHKFFYGQNVYGNPTDFQERCRLFINLLGEMLAGDEYSSDEAYKLLPEPMKWQVRRVDWAEMFRLSPAAQTEFFRALKNCKFPRRALKEAKYDTAVHFPGKFTTFRIYGKGAEFKKHDYPRLKRSLTAYQIKQAEFNSESYSWIDKKLSALQRLANYRLRVEVQVNSDKLNYDFKGRYPLVSEITDKYLVDIYQDQIFKLLREGKSEMQTVRTYDAVQARLNSLFGAKTANTLFAFWLKMSVRGEEVVRLDYSKSQFFSNRKRLVDSGISWHSSDVFVVPQDTALPKDFQPVVFDSRRCVTPISQNSIFNLCPVDQFDIRKAA